MRGFDSLTQEALERVIASYEEGLEDVRAGRINYPCGVSTRQVRRWLKLAQAELATR